MKHLTRLFLGLFFLGILNSACQEKNKKMNEKFKWKETLSCVVGYPVDVYRGGLSSADGGFTSLNLGTHTGIGGWGSPGRSMSNGLKSVPNRLHVVWLSYGEDCFYEVETAIDYEKMVGLFREGFYTPSLDPSRPSPFKKEYNQITVGFAPGGMVVVWLSGSGRSVEIGRYQGHKIEIPQDQIEQLGYPLKNLFNDEYRANTLTNERIVPKEIQEANRGKPIPYGLWDSYRHRYNWRLNFVLPQDGISLDVVVFYYNGEKEILFGESEVVQFPTIPAYLSWNYRGNKALAKELRISWHKKDQTLLVAEIKFTEEEIIKVFKEMYKETPEGEAVLEIRVNELETTASVQLIGNGKELWISDNKIEVFDTSKY